ncbi:MAG: DedA family protein [Frankiaceae bacterium]|nr:DedA family protein [Frankiaceae bacterium]
MHLTSLIDRLLDVRGPLVYLLVGLIVFAEDALFFGFVIPGETAAVLGGVIASRGHVAYPLIAATVVLAAIGGDSVGYEVGRRLGPRLLAVKPLRRHSARLDSAQDFLRRRGGAAVFLGRVVAFFRAVMPALAGTARMPYMKFLAFNAAGGIVWGVGFTLLGYLAGNSYQRIEKSAGQGAAILVVAVLVVALIAWRIREHRADKGDSPAPDAAERGGPHPK